MGQYRRKIKKGERWYYSGQYLGQKYFSKVIYLTKQEAKKAERAHIDGIDERMRRPKPETTLFELCEARLDFIEQNKSNFYYVENKRFFKKIIDHCGSNRAVGDITRKEINELLAIEAKRLKVEKKSNHKINSLIRCLKALFNYGIKSYDLEIKNPVMFVELYPIDIKLKHIPTEAEINAVRAKMSNKQVLLFDFVDQTACRISEAIRLKSDDIKGDLMTLWTRKSKNSNLTPRRIPIPECLAGYNGKGRVFDEWEAYPRFLEEKITELKQVKWSWHNLRHRRASIWATNGLTTFEIMSRLGHSNLSTTMIYLQLLGFTRL
jgi:integrase